MIYLSYGNLLTLIKIIKLFIKLENLYMKLRKFNNETIREYLNEQQQVENNLNPRAHLNDSMPSLIKSR